MFEISSLYDQFMLASFPHFIHQVFNSLLKIVILLSGFYQCPFLLQINLHR